MRSRIIFLLVTVAVLALACGPRLRGSDLIESARSARAHNKQQSGPALASALDVKMKNGVEFAFHVTNVGARKLEVNFPSGQTHDLVVLDSLGREAWRWSSGRIFTQTLQNRVLRGRDSLSFALRWRHAPAGHYVAVATLASDNFPVQQRAEFDVP